jgi:hypothetical protein
VTLCADVAAIRRTLSILLGPGNVGELRALNVPNGRGYLETHAGYFNDLNAMAKEAARLSDIGAEGVYATLNPVRKELLARSANRVVGARKRGTSTSDRDVTHRRWLLVDLDPERPSGISSSDAEREIASARAADVCRGLCASDWPEPLVGDSGNGFHLLYRIDLEADDRGLVQGVLEALAVRYGDGAVKVDTSVFNPARIEPEPVHWLWNGRIARGKLTVIDGDPGLGKSVLTCEIAARLSTGRALEGDLAAAPVSSIMLSAEDGLADTIRPRLEVAGADLNRVHLVSTVPAPDGVEGLPEIPAISLFCVPRSNGRAPRSYSLTPWLSISRATLTRTVTRTSGALSPRSQSSPKGWASRS